MKLGYTIIYVRNVPATVEFYEKAFDIAPRFIHESSEYAEMETGDTVLAFASNLVGEMNGLAIVPNIPNGPVAGFEVCFVTDDVNSAFEKALSFGATPVVKPCEKPWGQIVSYVRDINGCLVEIASPIQK